MLIGSDLYPHLLQSKSDIIHSPSLPSAMNTYLGWIIVGALEESPSTSKVSLTVKMTSETDKMLQRIWEIEEPEVQDIPTTEDAQCEDWFVKTISLDTTGRFCVRLPFRSVIVSQGHSTAVQLPELGRSRSMAMNRLYNLERRLIKEPELYEAYRIFMNEYLALGHMKLVPQNSGQYFIPHHAVVKRGESGLKIRVVFDASAKSSSGYSLNDCLATGPKLQTDITDILLRSRFQKYLFIADIEKMYRQIRVNETDCAYQHILWRNSPSDEVNEYKLCTVTYGVNAAPFLAIRCLHQLNRENGPEFPLAKDLLLISTYVDDIVAEVNTEEEVLALQCQVIMLLR